MAIFHQNCIMMKNGHLFLSLLLICYNNPAWADSYTDIENKYPSDTYIVGIAEAESSGNIYNDKTRVEILARLEIAKQIRVRIKEESLDIMCEGAPTVEEVKVVTAEGKIVLGDDTTPARARAIAMNNARRTALEAAVGVNLHGSSVIYNSDLARA